MYLSKVRVQNYRLLLDTELDVDENITVIVGRNNTAKTSFFDCIGTILKGAQFSYNDYPLSKRKNLLSKVKDFIEHRLSYDELCEQIEIIAVEFHIDYSLDGQDDYLGALSPFIIDIEREITSVLIRVENKLKANEKEFRDTFKLSGEETVNENDLSDILKSNFSGLFDIVIYAVNPQKRDERQVKKIKELQDLFALRVIPAERRLGEDGSQNSSLSKLISEFFNNREEDLDSDIAEKILELRSIVSTANKQIQKDSDRILSEVIEKTIGFGYPNAEELQLGVNSQLSIDEQISNKTELAYIAGDAGESLPNTYNGLGYKNLIKIEFILAAFAKDISQQGSGRIPLLFIEEPESHMHPQMQRTFAEYLQTFLKSISETPIQTFLTSHSPQIAHSFDFPKIRYAQKKRNGVSYKNLKGFSIESKEEFSFIKKYLTLARCDLFFADKVILVEGASERLLIPDMIEKCEKDRVFDSQKVKLSAQYYTLIEVGGAHAYIFIPLIDFLEIPCLILTDIDSVCKEKNKNGKVVYKSVPVCEGTTTSNVTLKWWVRQNKNLSKEDEGEITLKEITSMSPEDKTRRKCHIEFQTTENGRCGHSLEESIRNVNLQLFGLEENIKESELEFKGKKTDFALDLLNKEYQVPEYIKLGLKWLNDQSVQE